MPADFINTFINSGSRIMRAAAIQVRGLRPNATPQEKQQSDRAHSAVMDFFIPDRADHSAIAADIATARAELAAFTGFDDMDRQVLFDVLGKIADIARALSFGVYELPEWSISYSAPRTKGQLLAGFARLQTMITDQIASGF